MDTAGYCVDYKRNPEFFFKKLREMAGDFEKECQNTIFKLLTEGTIKEIREDLQSTIDKFIDGAFQKISLKVTKLVELEDNAKNKEPIVPSKIEDSKLDGLEEKYLLEKRDRLKKRLEEAIKESEAAESLLKAKLEKYPNNSFIK